MKNNVYSMVKSGMIMPMHTATGAPGSGYTDMGGALGLRNINSCGGYGGIGGISAIAAALGLGASLSPVGPYMMNYLRSLTPGSAVKSALGSAGSWAWRNKNMLMDLASNAYNNTVKPAMSNAYNKYLQPVKSTARINAGSIAQAALNPVAGATTFAMNNAGKAYGAAKRYAAPVVEGAANSLGSAFNAARNYITPTMTGVANNLGTVYNAAKSYVAPALSGVTGVARGLGNAIRGLF